MRIGLVGIAFCALSLAFAGQGDIREGHHIFLDYQCYTCHGFSGQNGPGRRLVPMRLSQAGFKAYVRKPSARAMPSYAPEVITDQQLDDAWAYIRTLQTAPRASEIPLLQRIEAGLRK